MTLCNVYLTLYGSLFLTNKSTIQWNVRTLLRQHIRHNNLQMRYTLCCSAVHALRCINTWYHNCAETMYSCLLWEYFVGKNLIISMNNIFYRVFSLVAYVEIWNYHLVSVELRRLERDFTVRDIVWTLFFTLCLRSSY